MDWLSMGIIVLIIVLLSVFQGLTQAAPHTKNCILGKREQAEGEKLIRNTADLEESKGRKERRDQNRE